MSKQTTKKRTQPCGNPLGEKRGGLPVPAGNGLTHASTKASWNAADGGILGQAPDEAAARYNYDKIKCAQHLRLENIENMAELFLEEFLTFLCQTLTELKADTDLSNKEKVAAIANLANVYNKMIKTSSIAASRLNRLAAAMDTLGELVKFVMEKQDVEPAKCLLDVFEPFGHELLKKWSHSIPK